MSYSLVEKVRHFAIASRVAIILLQFLTNVLVPDHDAGVFVKPHDPNRTQTRADQIVDLAFGGLTRWDAQYFLHVSQYGYTYENSLAFFPLFPLILRHLGHFASFLLNDGLALLLPVLKDCLSTHSILILVGVLLNNCLFVRSAVLLHDLTLTVLKSEKLAFLSAVLFCVNPASIFFSALYSESVYSFLTFYGLLQLERQSSLVTYVVVGMTGAVRSNGLINLGFLAYKYLKLCFLTKVPFFFSLIFVFGVGLSVLPFAAYQLYCYVKFCLPVRNAVPDFIYRYGTENGFVFPGSRSVWCNKFIPFAYSYVQKHYWNVDFLNYYEVKQIPNFLLAAPMVCIMVLGVVRFVKQHKLLLLYLGFKQGPSGDALSVTVFPYVLHGTALTLFAVLVIHVQVTTRLIASSTPLPYWYCALVLSSSLSSPLEARVLEKVTKKTADPQSLYYEPAESRKSRWKTFLFTETFSGYAFFIKWYFLLYFFVGTFMFSNHLPWT